MRLCIHIYLSKEYFQGPLLTRTSREGLFAFLSYEDGSLPLRGVRFPSQNQRPRLRKLSPTISIVNLFISFYFKLGGGESGREAGKQNPFPTWIGDLMLFFLLLREMIEHWVSAVIFVQKFFSFKPQFTLRGTSLCLSRVLM